MERPKKLSMHLELDTNDQQNRIFSKSTLATKKVSRASGNENVSVSRPRRSTMFIPFKSGNSILDKPENMLQAFSQFIASENIKLQNQLKLPN